MTRLSGLAYCSGVAPHRATGFDSLIVKAGSRSVSVKRFFCARYTTLPRIMAGCSGEALRPAGSFDASLSTSQQLATTFDSVMASLPKQSKEAANMANSTHPQIVYLPLVDAVDTGASREWQRIQQTEINLLYRVKRALDRAGVEWIDTRTGETSLVKTDNAEGCDNAQ
ncbi:host cell division inhibitor Icd-like protein [Salmonella enterica subsp. diarizonae]|nr:host cell division inhibitor Icd-like protein [Salmonella enterica subsp. diarizonae]EDQ5532209.1 host cell division inhibitor Icd-like protein [Salmonella enterica subsp. diarizonae]EHA0595471.1 host cell division inhibitor Icd-like protein [Salmonella enterica]